MKVVTGDLITLAIDGHFDVIVHGCNCHHAMKSGIAGQIVKDFPQADAADKKTNKSDPTKLGKYSICAVSDLRIALLVHCSKT